MQTAVKTIIFQLKQQQYGVDIQQVRSIERLVDVTEVPNTSDFIKGIINLRGQVIPIIDLKERLNLGKQDYSEETRVLIIEIEGVTAGLIVDEAKDVIDIDPEIIDPTPSMAGGVHSEFLRGVAKLEDRLLIMLDFASIFDTREIEEVKEINED
ncbi:chemotaxis protein CheW [Sediminibacillus dalangtanensis]|uniref:Chemotaxis protein CheW n=1 Tax=Sediminibacillus dalangtanensis TaxID=2729421 RepID=A0ABX7VY61_9BACI|nr:chemotaxis protein CheW [Sediminibacillus dalangtanensis]QTN00591.1 chemotaxis protein CheW [Sediminibacillus dalangtanensis]